jgi:hypothetical protein
MPVDQTQVLETFEQDAVSSIRQHLLSRLHQTPFAPHHHLFEFFTSFCFSRLLHRTGPAFDPLQALQQTSDYVLHDLCLLQRFSEWFDAYLVCSHHLNLREGICQIQTTCQVQARNLLQQ